MADAIPSRLYGPPQSLIWAAAAVLSTVSACHWRGRAKDAAQARKTCEAELEQLRKQAQARDEAATPTGHPVARCSEACCSHRVAATHRRSEACGSPSGEKRRSPWALGPPASWAARRVADVAGRRLGHQGPAKHHAAFLVRSALLGKHGL